MKKEHYDQDVIKSYSSYICHTPARKDTQANGILLFPKASPLPFSKFPIPPFLVSLVRSIHPFRGFGL